MRGNLVARARAIRFGALCNFECVAVTWRCQEDLSQRCQSFLRTGGTRRREEGAWAFIIYIYIYINEMGIRERHREDHVGWAPVPGIIIRGCIPERTEVSDETVGTSWCGGKGAPACLQCESSEMPQRHSFCDEGFRLRHCPAATEASVRLVSIQDWRGQSRENKECQATLSRRGPIGARDLEVRVNQVRIRHAHRGQSARGQRRVRQGLASCAPRAGHRHEGTHADSRLPSGVAISTSGSQAVSSLTQRYSSS